MGDEGDDEDDEEDWIHQVMRLCRNSSGLLWVPDDDIGV